MTMSSVNGGRPGMPSGAAAFVATSSNAGGRPGMPPGAVSAFAAASSNAGGRPGMPGGAAAFMGGSAAGGRPGMPGGTASCMGGGGAPQMGDSSWLSLSGMGPGEMGKGAFKSLAADASYGSYSMPSAGKAASALDGMPPAMPANIAGMPFGSPSSSYLGFGSASSSYLAGTQPSVMPGLPVTPAYEQAAAAMGGQGAPGASYGSKLYGDPMMNPFEAGNFEPRFTGGASQPKDIYQEMYGIGDKGQTLQSFETSGSAPYASQKSGMPASAFAGSNPVDSGAAPQYYGGHYGSTASLEDTASTLVGQTGQTAGFDGPNSTGDDTMAPSGKPQVGFPSTGSFVATPYDDEGLPSYYPDSGNLGAYDLGPTSSGAQGSRSIDAAALRDYGEVRQAGINGYESYMAGMLPGGGGGGATNGYDKYAYGGGPPQGPSPGAGGGATNGYDRYAYGGGPPQGPAANGYDSFQGSMAKSSANVYDSAAGGNRNGLTDYRSASDYGASQLYGKGASPPGVPPPGKSSYASIASPPPGGRQGSSMFPSTGSFVASPYAEGAPSFDALPPPASMPYSAPPFSMPDSGSFVASPFAAGAPSPDMFGMSMMPRQQNGYPDTYGSLPPPSLNMPSFYGGAQSSMGMSSRPSMPSSGGGAFGYPSPYGPGPSPSSFVGYDAEVPGSSLAAGNLGLGPQGGAHPQTGSFVAALPPSNGKEGSSGGGAGVRFSDQRNDHPGTDERSRARPDMEKPGRDYPADPNSNSRMQRGSKERDTPAPRTKRKTEKRACC